MRPLMSYQLGPKAMMANLIRQVVARVVVCPLIGPSCNWNQMRSFHNFLRKRVKKAWQRIIFLNNRNSSNTSKHGGRRQQCSLSNDIFIRQMQLWLVWQLCVGKLPKKAISLLENTYVLFGFTSELIFLNTLLLKTGFKLAWFFLNCIPIWVLELLVSS